MHKLARLALVASSIAALATLVAAADCGGGTKCDPANGNADCVNSTDAPVCDADTLTCVAGEAEPQCTETLACQVNDAGATDACTSTANCADGDFCIAGLDGIGHCVTGKSATFECTSVTNLVEASATDLDGDAQTICVDSTVSCGTDGNCAGGTFN